MKISEGLLKGRSIQYKEKKGTRVTSEKIRKAVFDVLKGLIEINGAKVADIFCGSGMYGIECLSRGASHVTFIDEGRGVIKQLKNNIKIFNFQFSIFNISYEKFIKTCDDKFDLVFADPPYYDFDFSKFNDIYKILNKESVFVLEGSKRVQFGELNNLELVIEKKYGDSIVHFYRLKKIK